MQNMPPIDALTRRLRATESKRIERAATQARGEYESLVAGMSDALMSTPDVTAAILVMEDVLARPARSRGKNQEVVAAYAEVLAAIESVHTAEAAAILNSEAEAFGEYIMSAAAGVDVSTTVFGRIANWFEDNAERVLGEIMRSENIYAIDLEYLNPATAAMETVSHNITLWLLEKLLMDIETFGDRIGENSEEQRTHVLENIRDYYLFGIGGAQPKVLVNFRVYRLNPDELSERGGNAVNALNAARNSAINMTERRLGDVNTIAQTFQGSITDMVNRRRRIEGGFCPFVIICNTELGLNRKARDWAIGNLFVYTEPPASNTSTYQDAFETKFSEFFEEMDVDDAKAEFFIKYKFDLNDAAAVDAMVRSYYTMDAATAKEMEHYDRTIMKMCLLSCGKYDEVEEFTGKAIKSFDRSLRGTMAKLKATDHFKVKESSRTACFLNSFMVCVENECMTADEDVKRFVREYILTTRANQKTTRVCEVATLLEKHGLCVSLYKDFDGSGDRKTTSRLYGAKGGKNVAKICVIGSHYFPMSDIPECITLIPEFSECKTTMDVYRELSTNSELTRCYSERELLSLKFNGEECFLKKAAADSAADMTRLYFDGCNIDADTVELNNQLKVFVDEEGVVIEDGEDSEAEEEEDGEAEEDDDGEVAAKPKKKTKTLLELPAKPQIKFTDILTFDTETYNHEYVGSEDRTIRTLPYAISWVSINNDVVATNEQRDHLEPFCNTHRRKTDVRDVSLQGIMKKCGAISPFAVRNDKDKSGYTADTLNPNRRYFATKELGSTGGDMPFFAWLCAVYGKTGCKAKDVPFLLIGAHNSTFDLGALIVQRYGAIIKTVEHKGKNVCCVFRIKDKLGRMVKVKLVDTYRMMPSALSALHSGIAGLAKEQCIYELYNSSTISRSENLPESEFDGYIVRRRADADRLSKINERMEFNAEEYIKFCRSWGAFKRAGEVDILRPALAYCVQDCLVLANAWLTQSMTYMKLFPRAEKSLFQSLSLPSYANSLSSDYGCLDRVVNMGGLTARFFQAGIVGGRVCSSALDCPRDEKTKSAEPFEYIASNAKAGDALVDFDANKLYLSIMWWCATAFPIGKPEHLILRKDGDSDILLMDTSVPVTNLYDALKILKSRNIMAYQLEVEFPDVITDSDRKRLAFPAVSVLRNRETGNVIKNPLEECNGAWRDWTNEGWEGTVHSASEVKINAWIKLHEFSEDFLKRIIYRGGMYFPSNEFNRNIKEFAELIDEGRTREKKLMKAAKDAGDEDAEKMHDNSQATYKLVGNSCYGKHGQAMQTRTSKACVGETALCNEILKSPSETVSFSTYGVREDGRKTFLVTKAVSMADITSKRLLASNSNRAHVACRILDAAHYVVGAVMKCIYLNGFRAFITDTDSIHTTRAALASLPETMVREFPDIWASKEKCINDTDFLAFHSDFEAPKLKGWTKDTPNGDAGKCPKGKARETVSIHLISLGKKSYYDDLRIIQYDIDDPFNMEKTTILPLHDGGEHVRQLGIPKECMKLVAADTYNGEIKGIYKALGSGKKLEFNLGAVGKVNFVRLTQGVKRMENEMERPGWVMSLASRMKENTRTVKYCEEGYAMPNLGSA